MGFKKSPDRKRTLYAYTVRIFKFLKKTTLFSYPKGFYVDLQWKEQLIIHQTIKEPLN